MRWVDAPVGTTQPPNSNLKNWREARGKLREGVRKMINVINDFHIGRLAGVLSGGEKKIDGKGMPEERWAAELIGRMAR